MITQILAMGRLKDTPRCCFSDLTRGVCCEREAEFRIVPEDSDLCDQLPACSQHLGVLLFGNGPWQIDRIVFERSA